MSVLQVNLWTCDFCGAVTPVTEKTSAWSDPVVVPPKGWGERLIPEAERNTPLEDCGDACPKCYTPEPAKEPVNQCDGCRRGLPIEDGIHRGEGYDLISCTASHYVGVTCPQCMGSGYKFSSGYLSGRATCLLCNGRGKVLPRGDGSYARLP